MPPPFHRALVTAPFRGPGLEVLEGLATVVLDPWIEHEPLRILDDGALAERVRAEGADLVICEADRCGPQVFAVEGLLAVAATRGDPTNVDLEAATSAGVPVLHAPGRNADGVAELAVGLLLAATRRIVAADRDVREGQVFRAGTIPYQRFRAWQVAGRTVGLVGLGAVGRAARWRFEGLGMSVISYDPFADDATHSSLEDLLAASDVVSMHAAVTPDTVGMIDASALEAMRDGVVYLNTARAALHDLDALTAALQSGKVAAAGLDHFEGEVLAPDHPLVSLDQVVLTPHIGGATYDTEASHSAIIARDLQRLLQGERPRHCANPAVLD